MTTANATNQDIAKLKKEEIQGDSLWADAFRRLMRNKMAVLGIIIILINIFVAVFADVLTPNFGVNEQNRELNNAAPQWIIDLFPTVIEENQENGYVKLANQYPLGADALGRDLMTRIIYGARISLMVAFIGPLVSLIIGVFLGLMAGYFGGWVDGLVMRAVDVMYAFPALLFIILLMSFFRGSITDVEPGTLAHTLSELDRSMGGMFFIFIGIGLTSWTGMARLTRGQVLSVREEEYVLAAKSIGAGRRKIMWRHVLPNIIGPIIVAETLTIPTYIRFEAFLSFIGIGVQPPTPSWGLMIAEGSRSIQSYPYQVLFPAIALFLIMFAFNFLGDGLRDALDPRMRGVN